MKVILDLDQLVADERISAAEAERLQSLAEAEVPPPRTRGLGSIVIAALVGLVLGQIGGAALMGVADLGGRWFGEQPFLSSFILGGILGAILGAGVGAFRWALFPYLKDH